MRWSTRCGGAATSSTFRHAATDFSQTVTDRQNLANCRAQRNLSDTGGLQARAIGQAFVALQIPVGQVLASY